MTTSAKIETNRMKLDRLAKAYILDAIDSEAYAIVTFTYEDKIKFLWETFNKEYGYMIKRVGE